MIDLSQITDRVESKHGKEFAVVAEREYRRFLRSFNFSNEPVVCLSKEADTFWHEHVTDTRKYRKDCDALFGKFLHHTPHGEYCVGDFGD